MMHGQTNNKSIIFPFVTYEPITLREEYRMKVCSRELDEWIPSFPSGYHACEMEVK
jgi:hypothetical protein